MLNHAFVSNSYYFFVVFGQITQQVFMAEEQNRDARKQADAEALTRADVVKSLGVVKQEQIELTEKLKVADQARLSAKASLKTTERQVEDQRQKLHLTEINLVTQRQLVIDLKVELQKAKKEAQLAREVAEAEKKASYLLGVEEMQIRLVEELSEVCRDFCNVTWDRAFSIAEVPADSVWWQLGSIYYHSDIREIPAATSSPPTPTPESSEQPLVIPDALPLPKVSKGSSQASDQGQGAEGVKDKGKGKGKKPSAETKDAAKDREAVAKAKEAEVKTKDVHPKAKDAPTSQTSQK